MHYKLLFPSLFLGAEDLQGKDVTLTMRRVLVEDLQGQGGQSEKKPCLFFEETRDKAEKNGAKEKRLVLNRTNAKTIAKLYGPEVDDWAGKQITLFPTTTQAFGDTVDCIRVRPAVPTATAQPTKES